MENIDSNSASTSLLENTDSDPTNDITDSVVSDPAIKTRQTRRKPGIIYLSSLPTGFDVMKTRQYFSQFGEISRLFLQPLQEEVNAKKKKSKKRPLFVEGWVEFASKRKAKWVTMMLNGKKVGGKKKDPSYDELWNIKYLPRFKWAYLRQRLEYERESYRQRMGAEITQVRQEADHFIKVSEVENKNKKFKKKITGIDTTKPSEPLMPTYIFKQRETETEVQKKMDKKAKEKLYKAKIAAGKKKKENMKLEKLKKLNSDEDFLGSVFVGSTK